MLVESLRSFLIYKTELNKPTYKNQGKLIMPYVCKDGLPIDFTYDSLQKTTFFSVDFFKVYSAPLKKQLKKGIDVLFVNFDLKKGQLQIMVSSRNVKLIKKKHINIAIKDWGNYFYEYSCEKKEWRLKRIEYGGV